MADPISVQCPHCKVKLKLKAAPPEGKKIGCPKCKKPFPVKAPPKKKAQEEDFLDALDDLSEDDYDAPEDENSEEQEEEAPVRSAKRSSGGGSKKGAVKGKKGRSKKSSAGPLLAIIGGSVAALTLIGGLVYFLMNLPGGGGPRGIQSASGEFLAFAPADADVYVAARPADILALPLMASLNQNPQAKQGMDKFEKEMGFPLAEIDHALFLMKVNADPAGGVAPGGPAAGNPMMAMPGGMPGGPQGGMPPAMQGVAAGGAGQSGARDGVILLRLKNPYGGKTLEQISQQSPPKSHNGVNYYVSPGPNGGSYFFGDERHAIAGPVSDIERIIDRKDQPEDNKLLSFFAKEQHFTMTASPKGSIAAQSPFAPPGLILELMQNANIQKMAQEISTIRLDVNMPGGIDLKVAVTCKSDATAQQVHAETTKQFGQLKQMAAFLKGGMPEIDSVMNSVQVSLTGPTMSVSASVPSALIDRLKQQAGPQTGGVSPNASLSTNLAVPPGTAPPTISVNPSATNLRPENPAEVEQAVERSHSRNLLKAVLLAFHNHHDLHKSFPAAYSVDANGRPLLSWRVHILPLIAEKPLYDQFHLNEPWDSEHNKTLIPLIPKTYSGFNEPELVKQGRTRIVVPTGPGMAFEGKDPLHFRDFLDGTSNTLMAVTVAPSAAVIWTKPDDLVVDPKMPLQNLAGPQTDTFPGAFADGAAREFKVTIAADVLSALFTRKGGESLPPNAF